MYLHVSTHIYVVWDSLNGKKPQKTLGLGSPVTLEALEQGIQPGVPGTEVQRANGLENHTTHMLLGEMRAVREELTALRTEVRELKALPPADRVSSEGAGLLTRLAARVERWLKWARE